MTDTGDLFPGDGELAHRLRELDWSTTELGPPERWPDPLRVAVRICLASPAPMSVWWGPQLALICNEACAALIGDAGPGRSGRESCAELWAAIGPPIERALATGEAVHTDDLELFVARALPREEVFVRLACTPLLEPG